QLARFGGARRPGHVGVAQVELEAELAQLFLVEAVAQKLHQARVGGLHGQRFGRGRAGRLRPVHARGRRRKDHRVVRLLVERGQEPVAQPDRFVHQPVIGRA
ncbi:hypothetical protein RZS08_45730, partial [Arthrospira platensis SPKY1]|nr:hypothetical protein [Arthrospira platensis SPKY1]